MYAVHIRFPAGRYHATRWDHHVNEGTVEWPPSPLRLLRALVATGFKLGWDPARIRAAVLALEGLPHYRLPPATAGHTRHFMPTDAIPVEKGRTLVFDAFYALADGATLGVAWPDAEPTDAVRADLDALWRSVGYLGRAESWAACEPVDVIGEPDAVPGVGGAQSASLLALEDAEALAAWRPTVPASGKRKRGPWTPGDGWDVLLLDTGVVQKAGWSRPPGVRTVEYALKRPPLVTPARRGAAAPRPQRRLALFALSSAVQPDVSRTVSVADRIRRAVMSRTTWLDDHGRRLEARRPDPDPLVWGRAPDGTVLQGHRHAYWLPFADDPRSRRLDRLLVRAGADEGLSERAIEALRSLRRVWGDDQHDLHTVLLGFDDDAELGSRSLLGPARVWVTDTPFVPTRHPKPQKGRDTIEDQIRRGLSQVGLPDPIVVEPLDEAAHGVPWHAIQTVRRGGGARARLRGVGVRLVFDAEVTGPIAIGWGAHFGMGRFRAVGS